MAILERVKAVAAITMIVLPVRTTKEGIVVVSPSERVRPVSTSNSVLPLLAVESDQLPIATHETVAACSSEHCVRTVLARHDVVILLSVYVVAARSTFNDVASAPTIDVVEAAVTVDVIVELRSLTRPGRRTVDRLIRRSPGDLRPKRTDTEAQHDAHRGREHPARGLPSKSLGRVAKNGRGRPGSYFSSSARKRASE